MQNRSSQLFALSVLLALSLLLLFVGSVDAHEDPKEADKRGKPTLFWFREQYKELYMFKETYPKPRRPKLVTEYPPIITTIVDKLARFGTREWNPNDDAIDLIRRFETATKATLVDTMHPDLIASQPKAVRKQHFRAMQKFVDWLHEHFDEIANLEGKDTTEKLLNRYKDVRNLAVLGAMVPHG
ncbi:uncharacterized protein UTRI_04653_B [Ustilago trichophora]|uniref:Uncharacterized protein n=1 Tax=Ustilago trichophora TaxID=86804 RepID=A0A5C3EF60_9BASI|nr:uncharacterized protein UTRI_04653_B [Ustilago trichophora]